MKFRGIVISWGALLPVLLSIVLELKFYNDGWRTQSLLMELAALGFIAYHVGKRFHWSAGALLFWAGLSPIFAFGFPRPLYAPFGPLMTMSFESVTAQAEVYLLLMLIPWLFVRKQHEGLILDTLAGICVIDSAILVVRTILGADTLGRYGLFGNHSVDACMIAITYPILALHPERRQDTLIRVFWDLFCVALPVGAVVMSKSSMGVLAMAAAFIGFHASRTDNEDELINWKAWGFAGSVVLLGLLIKGNTFSDDSGRFAMWSISFDFWDDHLMPMIGSGTGSFFLLGPLMQKLYHHAQTGQWFIFLHNDWMQIMYEQGLLGVGLAITLAVQCFKRCSSAGNRWLYASLSALGVTMLGNFPLHVVGPTMITGAVVYLSLSQLTEKNELS